MTVSLFGQNGFLATCFAAALALTGCKFDPSGLAETDGGSDAGLVPDGGPDPALSPVPSRPAEAALLPPTRAFLAWADGDIPAGRSVAAYQVCWTTGPMADIQGEADCPNAATTARRRHVIDPLSASSNVYWKVRSVYDDEGVSLYSGVRSFATDASVAGWWRFDEASGLTAFDGGGLGNDGSLVGDPARVPGKAGGALAFAGSNHVLVGDRPSLEGMAGLTVEAWIRTTSADANRPVVSKWFAGASSYVLRVGAAAPGRASFSTGASGNVDADGESVVNDGNWRHLVGTYDGSMQNLYLDTAPDAAAFQSGAIVNSEEEFCIGAFCDAGAPRGPGFVGEVDDVIVYNRALTAAEIVNSHCAIQALSGSDTLPPACEP